MKSWMTRRWCGVAFGLVLGSAGCGGVSREVGRATPFPASPGHAVEMEDPESGQHVHFVKVNGEWTRVRADTGSPAERLASARLEREREIEALVEQAMSAPAVGAKTAAALMVADRATGALADTIHGIDAARDVVLSNVKNADSTAYKSTRVLFSDGKLARTQIDFSQGSLENTSHQLDLGIQGQGFLRIKIESSNGDRTGYTRNGTFFINSRGDLVLGTGDGYKLIPSVNVPSGATDINISTDGAISVSNSGHRTKTMIAQLEITQFVNAQGLNLLGGSIFTESDASGPPLVSKPGENGAGMILQGFLESSNVDLFRERMRLRFLSEWRNAILDAVDRTEAKPKTIRTSTGDN